MKIKLLALAVLVASSTANANESNEEKKSTKVALPIVSVNPDKIEVDEAGNPILDVRTKAMLDNTAIVTNAGTVPLTDTPDVAPSDYLQAQITNPNGVYKAQNGKYYDMEGNEIHVEAAENVTEKLFDDVKKQYKKIQKLNLMPLGNVMVPVSAGLSNTLKTNFNSVAVKTSSSDAVIDIEGGYIQITPKSRNPIDLKIYEDGVLDTMVSITLIPFDLPPAMIEANIKLNQVLKDKVTEYREMIDQASRIAKDEAVHKQERYSNEHVERVKQILKPIAKGDIPKGFTIQEVTGSDGISPCKISIAHSIGQKLIGSRTIVDVVFVKNTWHDIYPLKEEYCVSDGVVAVGIYENALLKPGETAEIYILRDKLYQERKAKMRKRPRLNESMFRGK